MRPHPGPCKWPGCTGGAWSPGPQVCWLHYIDVVLMDRPIPKKRAPYGSLPRFIRQVPTAPLRDLIETRTRAWIADRTIEGIHRTAHGMLTEKGISHRVYRQVMEQDTVSWITADRIACRLRMPTALLYGFDWTRGDEPRRKKVAHEAA